MTRRLAVAACLVHLRVKPERVCSTPITRLLDSGPRSHGIPRNNGAGITEAVGVRCNPLLSLFVLFRVEE